MFPVFWVDGRVGLDVKIGMPNVGFTVTTSFADSTVTGVEALSVIPMQ